MSILGPEGYCSRCAFIVPLDPQGRLEAHRRGVSAHSPVDCPGGGLRPPRSYPYRSYKRAFSTVPPYALCHLCGNRTMVIADRTLYARHMARPGWYCDASHERVRKG